MMKELPKVTIPGPTYEEQHADAVQRALDRFRHALTGETAALVVADYVILANEYAKVHPLLAQLPRILAIIKTAVASEAKLAASQERASHSQGPGINLNIQEAIETRLRVDGLLSLVTLLETTIKDHHACK